MSYKSPISVLFFDDFLRDKLDPDDLIHQAVLKVQVDVDKPRLLRALNYDSKQYNHGYDDGHLDGYKKATEDITEAIMKLIEGVHYGKEETKQE